LKINHSIIVMLIATSWILSGPAGADGIIIVAPPQDVPSVGLNDALTIKYHRVDVTVEDQIATTRVDQVFVNDNFWAAEGTYIFPLPEEAAVSDFVMWVDGQPVRGEILEADQARNFYNDIVRQLRDPALLEYVDRKTLKASVFPIPPGGERRIELEYSQVLPLESGVVHYVYPLSTEKYSAQPLEEVTIKVEVESLVPIKAVYSPSHQVSIDRKDDFHAFLGMEQNDVLPDKDFEFYYTVTQEKVGLNLLSFKGTDEDGFFLLLAAPNVEVNPEEVVAKDLILVVDTSGSMDGEKLVQAKDAANYVLENLNYEDRFNVIAFDTVTETFSKELEPAKNKDRGTNFVGDFEARGSTDINRALLEALSIVQPRRPTTLIFLTDGLATEGVTDTSSILQNVNDATPDNVRLFCFGVGYDVDTDLLDQLSLDNRGSSTYVLPGQRIDEEVSAFYSKISTPILSDIELNFGDITVDRLYPVKTPDLFAGEQLLLVGRYEKGGNSTITLSGTMNDQKESFVYSDNYFQKMGGEEFVPRLWATRAIGHYLTQIRLYGEDQEWVDDVIDLSIRFGIITPYTSFLIDEGDVSTSEGREEIADRVKANIATDADEPSYGADAVTKAAYQGSMLQAATPASGYILPTNVYVSGTSSAYSGGYVNTGEVDKEDKSAEDAVKNVGIKTFFLRNGTWIDSAFDRTTAKPLEVIFLSEEYFDLMSSHPELGDYFALGELVIVIYDGTAYEVVAESKSTQF